MERATSLYEVDLQSTMRVPPRPGWGHSPVTGLSAGGLLGANCQKQGGGAAVLY